MWLNTLGTTLEAARLSMLICLIYAANNRCNEFERLGFIRFLPESLQHCSLSMLVMPVIMITNSINIVC